MALLQRHIRRLASDVCFARQAAAWALPQAAAVGSVNNLGPTVPATFSSRTGPYSLGIAAYCSVSGPGALATDAAAPATNQLNPPASPKQQQQQQQQQAVQELREQAPNALSAPKAQSSNPRTAFFDTLFPKGRALAEQLTRARDLHKIQALLADGKARGNVLSVPNPAATVVYVTALRAIKRVAYASQARRRNSRGNLGPGAGSQGAEGSSHAPAGFSNHHMHELLAQVADEWTFTCAHTTGLPQLLDFARVWVSIPGGPHLPKPLQDVMKFRLIIGPARNASEAIRTVENATANGQLLSDVRRMRMAEAQAAVRRAHQQKHQGQQVQQKEGEPGRSAEDTDAIYNSGYLRRWAEAGGGAPVVTISPDVTLKWAHVAASLNWYPTTNPEVWQLFTMGCIRGFERVTKHLLLQQQQQQEQQQAAVGSQPTGQLTADSSSSNTLQTSGAGIVGTSQQQQQDPDLEGRVAGTRHETLAQAIWAFNDMVHYPPEWTEALVRFARVYMSMAPPWALLVIQIALLSGPQPGPRQLLRDIGQAIVDSKPVLYPTGLVNLIAAHSKARIDHPTLIPLALQYLADTPVHDFSPAVLSTAMRSLQGLDRRHQRHVEALLDAWAPQVIELLQRLNPSSSAVAAASGIPDPSYSSNPLLDGTGDAQLPAVQRHPLAAAFRPLQTHLSVRSSWSKVRTKHLLNIADNVSIWRPNYPELAAAIVSYLLPRLPQMTLEEQLRLVQGMTRLKLRDVTTLGAAADSITRRLEQLLIQAQQQQQRQQQRALFLASSSSSSSSMEGSGTDVQMSHDAEGQPPGPRKLAVRRKEMLSRQLAQQLVWTVVCYSRQSYPHALLFDTAADLLVVSGALQQLQPPELSKLLYAYAVMGFRKHPTLAAAAAAAVGDSWTSFSTPHLAQSLQALQSLGHHGSELLATMWEERLRGEVEQHARLLQQNGRLMKTLQPEQQQQQDSHAPGTVMFHRGLIDLLAVFMKSGVYDQLTGAQQLLEVVQGSLQEYPVSNLHHLAVVLGRSGRQDMVAMLSSIVEELVRRGSSVPPQKLLSLLSQCNRVGAPQPALAAALARRAMAADQGEAVSAPQQAATQQPQDNLGFEPGMDSGTHMLAANWAPSFAQEQQQQQRAGRLRRKVAGGWQPTAASFQRQLLTQLQPYSAEVAGPYVVWAARQLQQVAPLLQPAELSAWCAGLAGHAPQVLLDQLSETERQQLAAVVTDAVQSAAERLSRQQQQQQQQQKPDSFRNPLSAITGAGPDIAGALAAAMDGTAVPAAGSGGAGGHHVFGLKQHSQRDDAAAGLQLATQLTQDARHLLASLGQVQGS